MHITYQNISLPQGDVMNTTICQIGHLYPDQRSHTISNLPYGRLGKYKHKENLMHTIGKLSFPNTQSELDNWEPYTIILPLHQNVLCIAQSRIEGTWSAFCSTVPGCKHSDEYQPVLDYGDCIPEHIARAMFPQFADVPYST